MELEYFLTKIEPKEFMKNIRNRMPVLLSLQHEIKYLSDDSENNLEK